MSVITLDLSVDPPSGRITANALELGEGFEFRNLEEMRSAVGSPAEHALWLAQVHLRLLGKTTEDADGVQIEFLPGAPDGNILKVRLPGGSP